ncbi:hypothetical protein, partial [Faecalibaculum rodentium]|uniref:hypothetical protein n=1 Tax=Faecalibaculum rodentium TaxID=1702221 RepID=UPI00258E9DC3
LVFTSFFLSSFQRASAPITDASIACASDEVTSFSKILNERSGCQARLCPQHSYILTHPQESVNTFFELFVLFCVVSC